jgi:hypothetical protein
VSKLDRFKDRIIIIPGATNDRRVLEEAVAGCDGVLNTGAAPAAVASRYTISPPHGPKHMAGV